LAQTGYIDAGIEHIHIQVTQTEAQCEKVIKEITLQNNTDLQILFKGHGLIPPYGDSLLLSSDHRLFITGKLAEITRNCLQKGSLIDPEAALWSAAKKMLSEHRLKDKTLGIIEISASGYLVVCIDDQGNLKNDLLISHPRCGAGTGVNLSRILEKLNIRHSEVDDILSAYLGDSGKTMRDQIPVRSDRCGVFSSSATISDKNQGIPLDYALGVTLKSEVMKPCKKMWPETHLVVLTGGVFRWQYARDCASDILKNRGVRQIIFHDHPSVLITGMKHLVKTVGVEKFKTQTVNSRLRPPAPLIEKPSFESLKNDFLKKGLYERLPDPDIIQVSPDRFMTEPVNLALDIGSTMAKIIIMHAESGALLFQNSYNNHGDTIETVKHIFRRLQTHSVSRLRIENLGITGSGRYQVQKALKAIYPQIAESIQVMVENYAHAWGSIEYAKMHIRKLKGRGIKNINEDFYVLVDIGGEDTKISVISLKKNELFDNAMNIKCSAGTGSLMDTLKSLFNIEDVAEAYQKALHAETAYEINATCAVFLMENARKMQAEGVPRERILASCCHAIVENMARSLWDQIEFPQNTIVLLHGQTMLSDPLPLAVTHRLQEYLGTDTYCLVPPLPGHRACIGLIQSFKSREAAAVDNTCELDALINQSFKKEIIFCHGAACGDRNARCARTRLSSTGTQKISLILGGCTAVNELQGKSRTQRSADIPDAYHNIWSYINDRLPKSDAPNRLVIPRSFAVSEKAFLLADIFRQAGIPVYVDNVRETDILEGQPLFRIDTCAPAIGATGQFLRLSREPHGVILVPQIDFLPSSGNGLGRTCTMNQGGILVAMHNAKLRYPEARFLCFDINIRQPNAESLIDQLYLATRSVFDFYQVSITKTQLLEFTREALENERRIHNEVADLACDAIQEAISKKLNVSIVNAREYILNPGIYDSHIGKLLRDKGVVAIPAHAIEIEPDPQFDFIYWKNPHDLITRSHAVTHRSLHRIATHKNLKRCLKSIETGLTESRLSLVTISTFRCGPDSVMKPILDQITKNTPTLFIQSDAMIAELAHLENRVNTHLNQLEKNMHHDLQQKTVSKSFGDMFDTFRLDQFKKDDVLYLPTAGDNRALTSLLRAAGLSVVENYDDQTYDLQRITKLGRKIVGDSVCAPLAAVYGDMICAGKEFAETVQKNRFADQRNKRLVLFMHTGDGPCRQGQYINICKLCLSRMKLAASDSEDAHLPVKFLENIWTSRHDKQDFLDLIDKWAAVQGFQALAIKDVLHTLFLTAGSGCHSHHEYQAFISDYQELKKTIYRIIENDFKPAQWKQRLVNHIEKRIPPLHGLAQYVGYGLYNNNGLRRVLNSFGRKWVSPAQNGKNHKIRIHVEGEIYLRVAQLEEIQKILIDTLGFGSFHLSYTAMWSFFEYVLESRIFLSEQEIDQLNYQLLTAQNRNVQHLKTEIAEKKRYIKKTKRQVSHLRNILTEPLYKAAGMESPHRMIHSIRAAKSILPRYRPVGELVPYVGETLSMLRHGIDLVLNVAPEGCMVASMGELFTPKIMEMAERNDVRIQHLFTNDGEINEDLLRLSLLKTTGVEKFYRQSDPIG
jgi:activator of 2-hydroxyglutaryl-CoA dehydratase/predicted nucleotide-binding protein (sugar kinase/HSP70/actin superfamily)